MTNVAPNQMAGVIRRVIQSPRLSRVQKMSCDTGTFARKRPDVPKLVGSQRAAGCQPCGCEGLMHMNSEIDISGILPAVRVPTLVIHRTGECRGRARRGSAYSRCPPL